MSVLNWFRRPRRRLLILFYNDFFGQDPAASPPAECLDECEFTSDRSRFREADAVVFHIPTMRDWPDVRKRKGQKWVAWSLESDVYYTQLKLSGFMSRFDLTQTYRLDSDVPVLYLDPGVAQEMCIPPVAKTAEAPAVLFTSNAGERCGRTGFIEELFQYVAIDSYGKHLRNKNLPEDKGRETKLQTIARYRFTLSFENSVTRDYVTEKFFDPLIAGSVPVYFGAPNIGEFAPGENCFINVASFSGPRELADFLKALDADPDRYDAYLAWKDRPFRPRFLELMESQRADFRCRLCRKLLS